MTADAQTHVETGLEEIKAEVAAPETPIADVDYLPPQPGPAAALDDYDPFDVDPEDVDDT